MGGRMQMGKDQVSEFLSTSAIAKKAKVAARVVFRRAQLSPRELQHGFVSGSVELSGKPICELIAGGQIIARGEIIEKDGTFHFKAKEAAS